MKRARLLSLVLGATAALCAYSAAWAETRLGLVVGNAGYPAAPLKTAVNDAALVGETLRQLGFDVSEGRDLDQTSLRRLVRDFAAKVEATDGDAIVYVYLAGHGIQAGAQNYFVPADARIMRPADVPAEALSVNALLQELVNQKVKARFVVLDSATKFPGAEAAKLAPGLAALNPATQALVAAAAAAGEIMPPQSGDYGVYALALTQAMREPGLTADEVFSRVTLQVHQETKGAVTPVQVSTLAQPFMFLERAPDAPPPPPRVARDPRTTPFRELDPATAYAVAIERNTLKDYREFLSVFPDDPLAAKIKARMAQRREALAWQKAARKKSREAYWTYRKFYPRGLHFEEAGLELVELGAPLRAPPDFEVETWEEFEPPPPEERAYYEEIIEQPGRYRDILPPPPPPMLMPRGTGYDYVPPPPPPSSGPGLLPLIGLGALGAAAIVPRIVRRPPPRSEAPAIIPRQPLPPPSIVNAPPPAGPRGPGAGAGLPGTTGTQVPPIQPPSGIAPPPGTRLPPGARPPALQPPVAGPPGSAPVPGTSAPAVTPPRGPLPGQIAPPQSATRTPASGLGAGAAPPVGAGGPPLPRPGQIAAPPANAAPAPVTTPAPATRPAQPATVAPIRAQRDGQRPAFDRAGRERLPIGQRPPQATPGIAPQGLPRTAPQSVPQVVRPIPPAVNAPVPRTIAPPSRPAVTAPAPVIRQPPPVARPAPPPAPAMRQAPPAPPVMRPAPPPPQAAPRGEPQGRTGCAPNDPRPQCR